ncbi:septum formation initiator family protein [uncultured Alistipes sp.]|jgi:cell division protein FtsB|uniref:FtsB family cell division protein n=1 Tax=uncultured Alistipes sp. TaxID=538949 RepID=UPI0023C8ADBD|nr:septum formation initiator family protein [uncultured Alistipes sp.]MDE7005948.1 septum formation initiator family protein [Alistipes sp.]MDE7304432.1 septum formation initiator family protein [Alistipes sp.]
MNLQTGRKLWVVATTVIIAFTIFIVGRNAVHAVKIKRQINALQREKEFFQAKIEADSTLLERLRYDEYLEEYAREHFRMQRPDEHVYIIEEE